MDFFDFLTGAYGNLITHIVLFVATLTAILINDAGRKETKI